MVVNSYFYCIFLWVVRHTNKHLVYFVLISLPNLTNKLCLHHLLIASQLVMPILELTLSSIKAEIG